MAVLSGDDAAWVRYGSAPLIVTLILPIVIGVILLLKCILNHCCVRKTTTKEEMYGVEGRMTILANAESSFVTSTPSQTQNLNSPPIATTVATAATTVTTTQTTNLNHHNFNTPEHSKNVSLKNPADCAVDLQACVSLPATDGTHQTTTSDSYETVDLTDSLKRTTLHRQLPDLPQIPQQVHNPPRRSSSVLSHDGTSELYATVGEVPNPATTSEHTTSTVTAISHYSDINLRQKSKKSVLPSTSQGASTSDVGPATKSAKLNQNEPTPSSDSETYATNHPYAKLKRNTSEHPYARVRTASAGNDEETDTDNYDIPQPYAQTRARPNNPNGQQSSSNLSQPSASSSGSANLNSNGDNGNGPVPPRRVGRQWRRSSHPQAQNNVDNQSHFSGDSQDSRGYTSISVREPLSNIRSQVSNTRQYDSHYATVSDDSEEMYAAIEDPSDGNYQRIAGEDGDGRQLWLAGVNVASPIPERREANSPLPPPPVPPPPGEIATTVGAAQAALLVQPQPAPVYAQVVKKSKKGKAPVTPTISNASVSSQIKENTTNDSTTIAGSSNNAVSLQSSSSVAPSTSTQVSTHQHHQHHSKNRHTIMDSTSYKDPNTSETRRWSKADISYSEFEVVRETLFNNSNNNSSPDISQLAPPHFDDTSSTREVVKATETTELLDEDNYNVIADTFSSKKRGSKGAGSSQSSSKSKSRHTKSSDSNNYQEIEQLTNPYQEIRPKHEKETSSDHYQTIDLVRQQGEDMYQEIDREKSIEDEEDEEEDQFYEKVKPSAKITASKSQSLVLPTSASGSLDRKHGYEKLKKKGQPTYLNTGSGGDTLSINSPGTSSTVGVSDVDDDDEDEDEGKNDTDSLYERVKYPPYERLKESRDDLADDDDGNLYEAIGYSRVKSKKQKYREGGDNQEDTTSAAQDGLVEAGAKKVDKEIDGDEEPTSVADLDQLYARVDKTKKKKNNSKINNDSLVTVCSNSSVMDSIVDGSLLDQESSENVNKTDTVVRKISSTGTGAGNSVQVVAEDNIVSVDYGTQTENTTQHFDNSIEYI